MRTDRSVARRLKDYFGLTEARPIAPIWLLLAIVIGLVGALLCRLAGLPGFVQTVALIALGLGCLVFSPTRN